MSAQFGPRDALSPEAFYSLYLGALDIEDESLRLDAACTLLLVGRLGLRPSELTHLHEGWIDWPRGELVVPVHDPCGCAECWERALERKNEGDERALEDIVATDYWQPPGGPDIPRVLPFGWSNRIAAALGTALEGGRYLDYDREDLAVLVRTSADNALGIDVDHVTLEELRATALEFLSRIGFDTDALAAIAAVDRETAAAFTRVNANEARKRLYAAGPGEQIDFSEYSPYRVVSDARPFQRELFDPRTHTADWRLERHERQTNRERNPRPVDPPPDVSFNPDERLVPDEPAGGTGPGVVSDTLAEWVDTMETRRQRQATPAALAASEEVDGASDDAGGEATSGDTGARTGNGPPGGDSSRYSSNERSVVSSNQGAEAMREDEQPADSGTGEDAESSVQKPNASTSPPTTGRSSAGSTTASGSPTGASPGGEETPPDGVDSDEAPSPTTEPPVDSADDGSGSDILDTDTSQLSSDVRDYLTTPIEFSVNTRFAASEIDNGRPSGGTVALGGRELVILSRDDTGIAEYLLIELDTIADLAPGYKPEGLVDKFGSTVGIAYEQEDEDRKVVVCEVPAEAQWAFMQTIFSSVLAEIPAVVSNLGAYERRVEGEEMNMSAFEESLAFWREDTSDPSAIIRYNRIVEVEEGKMNYEEEYRTGLIVHHLTSNDQVTETEVRPTSEQHMSLLKRLLLIHRNRKKRHAESVSITHAQEVILHALYNTGEGRNLSKILGVEEEDFNDTVDDLEEKGLIARTGSGVELTSIGFLVVNNEYGVVRTQ